MYRVPYLTYSTKGEITLAIVSGTKPMSDC